MEIQYLKEFETLAAVMNFTTAAELLFITQPTLSKHIAHLEKELHAPLFIRSQKNLQLTYAGQIFLPYARSILKTYQQGIHDIDSLILQKEGSLQLAFTFYGIDSMLTPLIAAMTETYPYIHIYLSSPDPEEPIQQLLRDECDVAETYRLPFPGSEELSFVDAKPISFSVAVPELHPLAQKESVSVRELLDETFVFTKSYPIFNGFIHNWFNNHDLSIHHELMVETPEILLFAVENSGAVAFLSNIEVGYNSRRIRFLPVSDSDFFVMSSYAWKKDNSNPCLPAFADTVRKVFAESK